MPGGVGVGIHGKPGYVGGGGAGVPGAGAVGGVKEGDACAMFVSCLDCLSMAYARASIIFALKRLSATLSPVDTKDSFARSGSFGLSA